MFWCSKSKELRDFVRADSGAIGGYNPSQISLSLTENDIPQKVSGLESRSEVEWSEVKLLSRVRLFATPWTVAYQAPPSMGFSRQEYWVGCRFLLQLGKQTPQKVITNEVARGEIDSDRVGRFWMLNFFILLWFLHLVNLNIKFFINVKLCLCDVHCQWIGKSAQFPYEAICCFVRKSYKNIHSFWSVIQLYKILQQNHIMEWYINH